VQVARRSEIQTGKPCNSVNNPVQLSGKIFNIIRNEIKKGICRCTSLFDFIVKVPYLTVSTIALKASGWFIARSARVFLFNVIPFLSSFPMNSE
jgi:hypothetical protein